MMIVVGLLAVVLNFAVLRSGDDRVAVAVAADQLLPGETITADTLESARVRADDAALRALIRADEIDRFSGYVATAPVAAGEPITTAGLREPASSTGLRAMSIPVDAAHAVGGQLAAGDRIDVIRVVDGRPRFIAAGIEVLSTGGADSGGALGGIQGYNVTVAVDATAALRLAAAIAAGNLEIVRSTGADDVEVDDPPTDPPTSNPASSVEREAGAGTEPVPDVESTIGG